MSVVPAWVSVVCCPTDAANRRSAPQGALSCTPPPRLLYERRSSTSPEGDAEHGELGMSGTGRPGGLRGHPPSHRPSAVPQPFTLVLRALGCRASGAGWLRWACSAVAPAGFGGKQQEGTHGKHPHFSQPLQPVIYQMRGWNKSQEPMQEPSSLAPGALHILFLSFGCILGLIRVPETPRSRESQPLITPPLRKHLPSSASSRLLLIFPFWFLLQGKPC